MHKTSRVVIVLIVVCIGATIMGFNFGVGRSARAVIAAQKERDELFGKYMSLSNEYAKSLIDYAEFWSEAVGDGHVPSHKFSFETAFQGSLAKADLISTQNLTIRRLVLETEAMIRGGEPGSYRAEIRDYPWFEGQIRSLKEMCRE